MATKQPEVEHVRKITSKVMLGDFAGEGGMADALFQRLVKEKKIPLYQIMGVVKAARTKTSDYGESIKFIGQFEATSLIEKGRVVRSSTCYLPRYIEEELYGLLGAGSQTHEAVTFAMEIGVQYDVKAATKYTYTARPLVNTTGGDELELLRQQVAKALPNPDKKAA
jgi:hypothetical protein